MKLDNKTEQVLTEIRDLLVSAELVPVELASDHLHIFYEKDCFGKIVGVIGIEVYGNDSFLRSLAVRKGMRNQGIARSLLNEALVFAKRIRSYNLYLITETIGETMSRHGFSDIPREQVPSAILKSPYFNGICPCSCRIMYRDIRVGEIAL